MTTVWRIEDTVHGTSGRHDEHVPKPKTYLAIARYFWKLGACLSDRHHPFCAKDELVRSTADRGPRQDEWIFADTLGLRRKIQSRD